MLKLNNIKDNKCINKHFFTETTTIHSHKKTYCSIIKPNDSSSNHNKLHQQKSAKHDIEELKNGHSNQTSIDIKNYSDIINYRPSINGIPKDTSYFEFKKLEFEFNFENAVLSMKNTLENELGKISKNPSGLIRFEIEIPRGITSLRLLCSQNDLIQKTNTFYYSSRKDVFMKTPGSLDAENASRDFISFCTMGYSQKWTNSDIQNSKITIREDHKKIKEILNKSNIRIIGGQRFDMEMESGEEWKEFGVYLYIMPCFEYIENNGNSSIFACNIAWDTAENANSDKNGFKYKNEAIKNALNLLFNINTQIEQNMAIPNINIISEIDEPKYETWSETIKKTMEILSNVKTDTIDSENKNLDEIIENSESNILAKSLQEEDESKISKIVIAKAKKIKHASKFNYLKILELLKMKNPNAYQIAMGMPGGSMFISTTPERLYARSYNHIITEAIAGTRPRVLEEGIENDFIMGTELLKSSKDNIEFLIVKDWLKNQLEEMCSEIDIEIPKAIIKQSTVQHLYSRIYGKLNSEITDLDIIDKLHPTPAVCGRPKSIALEKLRKIENFDRGFYAGPLGWMSSEGSEFAVSIRSALFHAKMMTVYIYAASGIVKKSEIDKEWLESELKMKQYLNLLRNNSNPLRDYKNKGFKRSAIIIEELNRMGINTFIMAPGSRSSALAYTVLMNKSIKELICVDERCLAYIALGYAKATGYPAPIIVTSGTAIANLLPAVFKGHINNVPMLLLTSDRPSELRDTNSNQTINQVEIFGNCVRWFQDLYPPCSEVSEKYILTTVDTAVSTSMDRTSSNKPGPVHLNLQFRKPLEPDAISGIASGEEQEIKKDEILNYWWQSREPYTKSNLNNHIIINDFNYFNTVLLESKKGILIIGELNTLNEVFVAQKIINYLQWPTVANVITRLNINSQARPCPYLFKDIRHIIQIIKDDNLPDNIIWIGGQFHSEYISNFIETCKYVNVVRISEYDNDISNNVSMFIKSDLESFAKHLELEMLNYKLNGQQMYLETLYKKLTYFKRINYNDKEIFNEENIMKEIVKSVPKSNVLYSGDLYISNLLDTFITYVNKNQIIMGNNECYQGSSGSLSTAIGYSIGLNNSITLVLSHLTILNDLNALSVLSYVNNDIIPPITIIILNNSNFKKFSNICEAYQITYVQIEKIDELKSNLDMAWKSNRHCLLEICTCFSIS